MCWVLGCRQCHHYRRYRPCAIAASAIGPGDLTDTVFAGDFHNDAFTGDAKRATVAFAGHFADTAIAGDTTDTAFAGDCMDTTFAGELASVTNSTNGSSHVAPVTSTTVWTWPMATAARGHYTATLATIVTLPPVGSSRFTTTRSVS